MERAKKTHSTQVRSVIRALKLLEVLKVNTDSRHKLTQREVLELMEKEEGQCTEKTLSRDIRNLMAVLNPVIDEYGEREDEFKIVYDGIESGKNNISGVRYIHDFTNDDLELLVELVKSDVDISKEDRGLLEKKLKRLGSKHYRYRTDAVGSVRQFSTIDKTHLKENLAMIKAAIAQKKKVSFIFNGYNREKKLTPVRERRYVVSPYYLVIYGMKYYLLANTEPYENVSIYRVDLMSEAEVLDEKRKDSREVHGLEHDGITEYIEKHLNMYYDQPRSVTLKVRKDGYTILHDSFGEKYTVKRAIDSDYDEVDVDCSEHAMIDWAIQFDERIEVMRPLGIRKKIKEKAFKLAQQYEI